MPTCPSCSSSQIVVVIGPSPHAFCASCGTRWVQEGGYQRSIQPTAAGRIMAARRRSLDLEDELVAVGDDR